MDRLEFEELELQVQQSGQSLKSYLQQLNVSYSTNHYWRKKYWHRVNVRSDHTGKPVCFIVDDTDYPKRGIHTEKIGRIFIHVSHRMILGFKSLVLAISDGKSQMAIVFELVGEPRKKGDHFMSDAKLGGRFEKAVVLKRSETRRVLENPV